MGTDKDETQKHVMIDHASYVCVFCWEVLKVYEREEVMKINQLWGSRLKKGSAKGLLAFTSGRDVKVTQPYDQRLIPYDVWGSKAHAIMLWKQGLVSKVEIRNILKGLDKIEALYQKGTFKVDPKKEDVHSTVESYLIEHYGMESAGRLHTGRSRNDQVAVDMRLYLRAEVMEYVRLLLDLLRDLTDVATVHVDTIMPGYSHHQPAMIGSFGHLLFSFAVSMERDVKRLIHWFAMFNINPLGGVAGYGSCLPLDRNLTAGLMGFDGIHESSIDPPQNRWEPELELGYDISVMMNHLSNLAQTLILMGTLEFGMVEIDDAYCTGSSIMPQKKNPDPLEVIKGKAAYAQGMAMAILSSGRSLFAGYNRDSQWSKYPVMDVIDECKPSLAVMGEIIATLKFNKELAYRRCEKGFIAATDVVEWLVHDYHLPFREAKIVVEKAVSYSEKGGHETIQLDSLERALREVKIKMKIKKKDLEECQIPERVLHERKTKGGPSPKELKTEIRLFQKALQRHENWLKEREAKIKKAQAEVHKITRSLI